MLNRQVLGWMKDSLFILVAYSGKSGDRVGQAVSRLVKDLWVKTRKNRFSIVVYTDVDRPLYIEHFRSFIQSNIANSITIWWRPLEMIIYDIEESKVPKSHVLALIDKDLAKELEVLRERVSALEEF